MHLHFRILKISVLTTIFLSFGSAFAHKGKPTFVLEEFSRLTDRIDLENENRTDVSALETLLEKGGEKEKDSEVFRKALPLVRTLGRTSDPKIKQKLYSDLVSLFERILGYHDRSGAILYHCPKSGKEWITNSPNVQNPFDRRNPSCIQKME